MSEPKNKTKAETPRTRAEEIEELKLELFRVLVKFARLAERALTMWADSKKPK